MMTVSIRPACALAALLSLTAGCKGTTPPSDPPGQRNAGGLAIVDSTRLRCVEQFRATDSLRSQFGEVAIGPGGLIAWQPFGRPMLVIRRPDGSDIRVAGGPGLKGFLGAAAMGWRGDTLWLSDQGSTRVVRFGADGHFIAASNASDLATWIPGADGRLRAVAAAGMTKGVPDTTLAIVATAPGSRQIDTMISVPTPALKFVRLHGHPVQNPLSERTIWGGAVTGDRWCAAIASDGGVQLRCYDARDKQLFDQQVSLQPRPMEDDIYRAVIATLMSSGERSIAALEAAVPRPATLPLVVAVQVARNGEVWLQRSWSSEATQIWLRLAADGTPRDEIHLPRRYALRDLTGDSIWAAESDSIGFQRMTLCTVKAGAGKE